MRRFLPLVGLLLLLMAVLLMPITAQPPVFVTNTPRPPDPLASTPDAPVTQYALRLWSENQLIEVLASQLRRLNDGEMAQADAIRLTQYELARRFPGAPRDPAQRARLLALMLDAPRGSVDMRAIARPYLLAQLGDIDPARPNSVDIDAFLVQTTPVNIDNDEFPDAVIAIRYPSEAVTLMETLYKDYLLVKGNAAGGYDLLPTTPDFPAAPFNTVEDVNLTRLGDVNLNGLDEMAIAVSSGGINQEVIVYGWRNGQIISLVQPGEAIAFGELINWTEDSAELTVARYEMMSEKWQCIGAQRITWNWENNFYRPTVLNALENLPSFGCRLAEAEPLFSRPPAEAVETVLNILKDGTLLPQGTTRGGMALAMFYLLDNRLPDTESQIAGLLPQGETDPWLAQQIDAFTLAASQGTPVQVCAALVAQNADGACDVDQVIERILTTNPIQRSGDLVAQLEALDLPVAEVVTVAQVGFANRQVVRFDLAGTSWWAFAPTDPDVYIPNITVPPVQEEAAANAPASDVVEATETLYRVLTTRNDPATALITLDNLRGASPGLPLSAEAQFIQALSLELVGDREGARAGYYNLWLQDAGGTWGRLAGAHLERRGQ
ncbi:MAG: hypothetical protein OHK0046_44660 [Anaerolineae bacterium]